MRLLVDTHALLWFQSSDTRLSNKAADLIKDPDNLCFVSMVSLWEISIKLNIDKLKIEIGYQNFLDHILSHGFQMLNINFDHLNTLQTLPQHHGDPFDRMLIAQAITEGLTIISADRHFSAYPVGVSY